MNVALRNKKLTAVNCNGKLREIDLVKLTANEAIIMNETISV